MHKSCFVGSCILKQHSPINTDASLEGWVASMGNVSTGKAWLPDEKLIHINVLELQTILLALKSFVKASDQHIQLLSDNTTSFHFINTTGISH